MGASRVLKTGPDQGSEPKILANMAELAQYRRAVAAIAQIDFDFGIAGLNLDMLKTFEHLNSLKSTNYKYRQYESHHLRSITCLRQTSAAPV